jgi:hypothetical protein
MQMVMSERLRRQRVELKLVCACEECEHFDDRDGPACDLLYPTAPHRRAAFDSAKDGDPVWFCKMFEAR